MDRHRRRWPRCLTGALCAWAVLCAVLVGPRAAAQATVPGATAPDAASEVAAARAHASRGDALLASAREAEALAQYHEALRRLGARLPAFTSARPPAPSDYAALRIDDVTDTLLVGEVLGRVANAYLHVFFQGPDRLSGDVTRLRARPNDPIAQRHGLGMAAADASLRVLDEMYREFVIQAGGPVSLHERRNVWRLMRRAFDLKMDDRTDFYRILGGDGKLALLAFSEALQHRAPTLLEAVWLRRLAFLRALSKEQMGRMSPQLLTSYAQLGEHSLLYGYARDAVLAERDEQRPREALIRGLEQEIRALGPGVRTSVDGILAAFDPADADLRKTFNSLWWYPRHWLVGGFLLESGLASDEALIQFHETPRRLLAFVFNPAAADRERAVTLLALSSDPQSIAAKVATLNRQLRQRSPDWQSSASNLFLDLLAPLAPYLREKTRLFVVPSGSLNTLPFQALIDPRVAAPPPVVLMPHAELLGPRLKAPAETGKSGALVVGIDRFTDMPRLDRAESEAQFVARALGAGSTLLLGSRAEATRARVLAGLNNKAVIHIASHARFDRRAMQSSVMVNEVGGGDAVITGFDLLRPGVRLDGALVVLSACDTGGLATDEGEDPLGLASGLLIAGAKAVVVSQWSVADRAAEWIMRRFYQELKGGLSAGNALAVATQALRETLPEFSHPHYWAAFVVIGDGRWRLPDAMR